MEEKSTGKKPKRVWLKRVIIMVVIVAVAFVLGRLAVRAFMNLLVGGTLFGGNFL